MVEIFILVTTFIILAIGLNIKISDIKKIKAIGYDKELNKITNKLPNNIDICKAMLKIIKNDKVQIEKNGKSKTSFYLVMKNKIIIANIDDTFTRVQTLAHECIHSIQNKKVLKFNHIFSNIYIIYFILICILIIFKIINGAEIINIFFIVLIMLSLIYFSVRGFLEVDAMTRAKYLAKEYIEEEETLSEDEERCIMEKYDIINKTGIKFYLFTLISGTILKALIFCIIAIIFA